MEVKFLVNLIFRYPKVKPPTLPLHNTQLLSVSSAVFQELSTTENADPDTTTRMSSTLETNAARAESAYRQTLQNFIGAESTSATVRWDMDRYDRVY